MRPSRSTFRALLALLALVVCLCAAVPARANTQTCVIVTVRDGFGAPLAGVAVTRNGGNAKPTDASGRTFWCLAAGSSSSTLAIPDGAILRASGRDCTARLSGGTVSVHWTAGVYESVEVMLTASVAVNTPTPRATAPPTATLGPTPTWPPTPTPWDGWYDASAIVQVEPVHPEGRYRFEVIEGGGVDLAMQTFEGGDYPSGCGVDCITAFGWARMYFECDCPPMPPSLVVTATPDGRLTPEPEEATPTATLTIPEEMGRISARIRDEWGFQPYWALVTDGGSR